MEESRRYSNLLVNTQKGGNKVKTKSPKKKQYSPLGDNESSALQKLFKQNRLLTKELEETKSELQKVKQQLNYEKKKNKSLNF
tara:strand:+ start:112 stop:360 length:249 start_codon:yes stop_codon:yes gene_type:complete